MSNRYTNSQKFDARHIDLQDQLTFYGTTNYKGSIHMWCKAFNIESPKEEEITGDMVGKYFNEGKYLEIARYNAGDLTATKRLYEYWNKNLRF